MDGSTWVVETRDGTATMTQDYEMVQNFICATWNKFMGKNSSYLQTNQVWLYSISFIRHISHSITW